MKVGVGISDEYHTKDGKESESQKFEVAWSDRTSERKDEAKVRGQNRRLAVRRSLRIQSTARDIWCHH